MILFKEWFFHHFLWHTGSARPLLLLLDGHSSHYDMDIITMVRENDVIVFTLVPHTTRKMQPLDTAVFEPLIPVGKRLVIATLKKSWKGVCPFNPKAVTHAMQTVISNPVDKVHCSVIIQCQQQ